MERFGTLAIRMAPDGGAVFVDGEAWTGKPGAIPLTVGRHTIEVRRSGYQTYTEDVLIRAERTLTLEAKLVR